MRDRGRNYSQGNVLLADMLEHCKTKGDIKKLLRILGPLDTKKRINMVIKRYDEIMGKKVNNI